MGDHKSWEENNNFRRFKGSKIGQLVVKVSENLLYNMCMKQSNNNKLIMKTV